MADLTDAQAEKARADLAAYEAKKLSEAMAAEETRRAEGRALLAPVAAAVQAPAFADGLAALEGLGNALPQGERDLAFLIRNHVITGESIVQRIAVRLADLAPAPTAEEPAAAPEPSA